jgi:hypothetical protein
VVRKDAGLSASDSLSGSVARLGNHVFRITGGAMPLGVELPIVLYDRERVGDSAPLKCLQLHIRAQSPPEDEHTACPSLAVTPAGGGLASGQPRCHRIRAEKTTLALPLCNVRWCAVCLACYAGVRPPAEWQGMGYTIFSVGDEVCIVGGTFVGIEGIVVPPSEIHRTATLASGGESKLLPVTVSVIIDGHQVNLRVPPELLKRIVERGGEDLGTI